MLRIVLIAILRRHELCVLILNSSTSVTIFSIRKVEVTASRTKPIATTCIELASWCNWTSMLIVMISVVIVLMVIIIVVVVMMMVILILTVHVIEITHRSDFAVIIAIHHVLMVHWSIRSD